VSHWRTVSGAWRCERNISGPGPCGMVACRIGNEALRRGRTTTPPGPGRPPSGPLGQSEWNHRPCRGTILTLPRQALAPPVIPWIHRKQRGKEDPVIRRSIDFSSLASLCAFLQEYAGLSSAVPSGPCLVYPSHPCLSHFLKWLAPGLTKWPRRTAANRKPARRRRIGTHLRRRVSRIMAQAS
jgi:hypothetical protein